MYEPLIALGLFGGVVWVIAQAIFMLMHGNAIGNGNVDVAYQHRDTLASFVEQNYGTRFVSGNPLGEEGLRRL